MMNFFLPLSIVLSLLGLISATPKEEDGFFAPGPEGSFVYNREPSIGYGKSGKSVSRSNGLDCEGIAEICRQAEDDVEDYEDLKVSCNLLETTEYLTGSTLDSLDEYTIFLPTNLAIARLFEDVLGEDETNDGVTFEFIKDFFKNHIIKGEKLLGDDFLCGDKPNFLVKEIAKKKNWPKISCKKDILGTNVAYIKGPLNTEKEFEPRVQDPSNPIITCKDNIFLIENVILVGGEGE